MSAFIDDHIDRANEMSIAIWRYMDVLSKHSETLPDGQTKQYLQHYISTLSWIGELYAFTCMAFGDIKLVKEMIKPLGKEVFGDREIQLPYQPKEDETLRGIIKSYKEREPFIDWQKRRLDEEAKDLENQYKDDNNTRNE